MTCPNENPLKLTSAEIEVLSLRPQTPTPDFAENDFVLVTGTYAGRNFNHDFAPYARGMMEIWDLPWTREMIVAGSSQTVKTTVGYVCISSEMEREPSPTGLGMPDEKVAKRIIKEKAGPHFKRSPKLRKMLPDGEKSVQALSINTHSATLYGLISGSEASMSSVSLRVLMLDEEDAYADPGSVETMLERTIGYPVDSKVIRVSKPRGNEYQSSIWKALTHKAQVVYQYRAVCPTCGHAQVMDHKHIRVPDNVRDPAQIRHQKLAWYECQGCKAYWSDYKRNEAIKRGHWHCDQDVSRPECVAFHIPAWISRYVSLSTVAAAWFEAVKDGTPKAMQRFDNDFCAKPHKVVAIETNETRSRKMVDPELPPMVAPAEAVAITCGIDMQMTGFWFVTRAWGRDMRSWLMQYGWLNNFDDVEELLFRTRYPVEGRDDVVMPIWRAGIDIGGNKDESNEHGWSKTDEVKAWLFALQTGMRPGCWPGLVHGVKGASRPQEETVRASTMGGQPGVPAKYQQKLPLYLLDTNQMKDKFHLVRMNPASRQPAWLHSQTGEDYFKQIHAEDRGPDGKWIAKKRDNHLLDCEVYCHACAEHIWTPSLTTLGSPYVMPKNPVVIQQEPVINPYTGEVG